MFNSIKRLDTWNWSQLLLSFICFLLIASAYALEIFLELEPCPLCILQRFILIMLLLITLAGILIPPIYKLRIAYFSVVCLMIFLSLIISVRHLYLQFLGVDNVPACGPGLDILMDILPIGELLSTVWTGDASCAEVVWTFMGISIPGWALIGTVGLLILTMTCIPLMRKDKKELT